MITEAVKHWQNAKGHFETALGNTGTVWQRNLRQQGWEQFAKTGLPTTQLEAWKNTPLQTLAHGQPALPSKQPLHTTTSTGPRYCIEVVDGQLATPASPSPEGVTVSTFLQSDEALLQRNLHTLITDPEEPIAALNTAFLYDGIFIHIAPGLTTPVDLELCWQTQRDDAVHFPRLLVLVGTGSKVTLVERFENAKGTKNYVCGPVAELILEPQSYLTHMRIQQEAQNAEHLGSVAVRLDKESTLRAHYVDLGAKLSRMSLSASLAAEGANCSISNVHAATNHQHISHRIVIDHLAPHCTSDVFVKGVLDDHATNVFNAKALVRQYAQHSSAFQKNHNLLLSDGATAHTRPQLEIYADDVQCAHGATVGQLNNDHLFYLQTRGIAMQDAKRMLTLGFVEDAIERIEDEHIRTEVGTKIKKRLERSA